MFFTQDYVHFSVMPWNCTSDGKWMWHHVNNIWYKNEMWKIDVTINESINWYMSNFLKMYVYVKVNWHESHMWENKLIMSKKFNDKQIMSEKI